VACAWARRPLPPWPQGPSNLHQPTEAMLHPQTMKAPPGPSSPGNDRLGQRRNSGTARRRRACEFHLGERLQPVLRPIDGVTPRAQERGDSRLNHHRPGWAHLGQLLLSTDVAPPILAHRRRRDPPLKQMWSYVDEAAHQSDRGGLRQLDPRQRGAESPSLVLVINDTKLLMRCVKCFELGISNTCDEGVRGKEWWPQDHKMGHGHEMTIMVEIHII
jgi:hypothetical protein